MRISWKRLGKPGMTGGEMTEPLGMEPLGKAVEMMEIICMKPFGVKVIGMAPLRMELAKLRTAAELLERHTDLELLEPLGMEMAEMDECSKPWA